MTNHHVPHKSRAQRFFEKYMYVIGILGQMVYFSQGIEIFITRSAEDISVIGFTLGFVAVFSWFMYGMILKNRVIAIANLVGTIGALLVLIGILIYK